QDRFTHEYFIKGAYPERELVARVYTTLQRLAHGTTTISESPEELASSVPGKVNARDIESALRVIEQAGATVKAQESASLVRVRLLATPARIKRELSNTDDAIALGVLRALWRAAGNDLNDGAIVDIASLPSGLGAPMEIQDTLESLESRQFVTVQRLGGGITLVAPSRDLDSFKVDWKSLDQRREAELEKLEAVQRYAYAKSCRRAFVLRYFGDPAAGNSCSGCDNCEGTAAPRPPKDEAPARSRSSGRTRGGAVPTPDRGAPSAHSLRVRRAARNRTRQDRTFRCAVHGRADRRPGVTRYQSMDDSFYFSEQHLAVRDTVRGFARDHVAPVAAKLDAEGKFLWDNVKGMGELGLLGVPWPEELGGAGLDLTSYIIAIHEMAKVDASHAITISAHTTLGTSPIVKFGNDAQRRRYVPLLASGKVLGGFGLTEPSAGSDAGGTRTRAEKRGDRYILNGSKIFITHGGVGEIFVVTAVTDPSKGTKGISSFI